MPRIVETKDAPPPFSRYSQAVAVDSPGRLVFVSGQVGVTSDGFLQPSEEVQHEQCWRNILAILAAEGLSAGNIVDVRAYVTQASGMALYRRVRDRMLDGAAPASTLVVVAGLADPNWLVEISAVAAADG